jgi:predicted dehydrogenase
VSLQGAKRRGNPFPHTIKTAAQPGGGFLYVMVYYFSMTHSLLGVNSTR